MEYDGCALGRGVRLVKCCCFVVQAVEGYFVYFAGVVGTVFRGPDLGVVFPGAFPETGWWVSVRETGGNGERGKGELTSTLSPYTLLLLDTADREALPCRFRMLGRISRRSLLLCSMLFFL